MNRPRSGDWSDFRGEWTRGSTEEAANERRQRAQRLVGILAHARLSFCEHRAMTLNRDAVRVAAARDPLTGLGNLGQLLETSQVRGPDSATRAIAVCLDITDLKTVNGMLGFAIGDQILKSVAERLQRLAPAGDAFRTGGSEFTVLLPSDTSPATISGSDLERELALVVDAVTVPVRLPLPVQASAQDRIAGAPYGRLGAVQKASTTYPPGATATRPGRRWTR